MGPATVRTEPWSGRSRPECPHLGQYKYTPGLKAYNLSHLRSMGVDPSTLDPADMAAKAAYMTDLEGYAKYIETDFLKAKFYPMALLTYHASAWEKMKRGMVAMMTPEVEDAQDAKAAQYTDGLAKYRAAQVGDVPVRWEYDVSALPGGDEFLSA